MYGSFRPGKFWYDNNGKLIQAHGGSIISANGKYYWYGENKEGITGNATGEKCRFWHHGVKLYSSTDLYNWTDEGFCVRESDDIESPFHPTHIMDRPHILYNEKNNNFVLWAKVSFGDFSSCAFAICVGKELKDMTYVKLLKCTPHCSGDFDMFVEGGKGYVIFENPHTSFICRELDDDFTGFANENFNEQLKKECPPYVREAPAYFTHNGKRFLLTSGTTGYYPNETHTEDVSDLFGKWKELGNTCVNDKNKNSFRSQFSSVFKHPEIEGLYIALGDRWLLDTTEDLPDMNKVFFDLCSERSKHKIEPKDLVTYSEENTSMATYVWLPITFDKKGKPKIAWRREWKIEEFKK